MLFSLDTEAILYTQEGAEELMKLGFSFDKHVSGTFIKKRHERDVKIEINTLDELMTFVKDWGSVVLTTDANGESASIEI